MLSGPLTRVVAALAAWPLPAAPQGGSGGEIAASPAPWISVGPACELDDPCDPGAPRADGSSCAFSGFATALAALADLDGDGRPELAVGAPRADDPAGAAESDVGWVGVHASKSGALLWQRHGDVFGGALGSALAALGDVDGDGRGDLLVGAPVAGRFPCAPAPGRALVLSGASGATIRLFTGAETDDRFGAAVSPAADVGGDGVDELAVAAPRSDAGGLDAGSVRVFDGATGAPLWTVHGSAVLARFGTTLARIGDLDGDGRAELAIGAPRAAGEGEVRVLSGATGALLWSRAGAAPGERFGAALAPIGDLDGDGKDELLVGAPGAGGVGRNAGAVTVLSGADGEPILFVPGFAAGERFGAALLALGDLDGDGQPEIAAGAPRAPQLDAKQRGAVRVFRGANAGLWRTLQGGAPGDRFGSSLAPAGDHDGNGRANELWVGAPLADRLQPVGAACPQFTDSGAASLWAP